LKVFYKNRIENKIFIEKHEFILKHKFKIVEAKQMISPCANKINNNVGF